MLRKNKCRNFLKRKGQSILRKLGIQCGCNCKSHWHVQIFILLNNGRLSPSLLATKFIWWRSVNHLQQWVEVELCSALGLAFLIVFLRWVEVDHYNFHSPFLTHSLLLVSTDQGLQWSVQCKINKCNNFSSFEMEGAQAAHMIVNPWPSDQIQQSYIESRHQTTASSGLCDHIPGTSRTTMFSFKYS